MLTDHCLLPPKSSHPLQMSPPPTSSLSTQTTSSSAFSGPTPPCRTCSRRSAPDPQTLHDPTNGRRRRSQHVCRLFRHVARIPDPSCPSHSPIRASVRCAHVGPHSPFCSVSLDLGTLPQIWICRTQLDTMRTVCYKPGPLVVPDLGEFSMDTTTKA
jgi:hypothetical protein